MKSDGLFPDKICYDLDSYCIDVFIKNVLTDRQTVFCEVVSLSKREISL